jgi:hypothetical protein
MEKRDGEMNRGGGGGIKCVVKSAREECADNVGK